MEMRRAFWLNLADGAAFHAAVSTRVWGDLTLDSRRVRRGDIFIAIPGAQCDGRDFIPAALQQGAAAILQPGQAFTWHWQNDCCVVTVPDLSPRLGDLAACYYHHPSQHLHLHAITGTNGKTSCSHFLAQALNLLGHKAAVVGTLGYGFLDDLIALDNTTPDAVTLQRLLAELLSQGATHVVMEASSIALVQGRLNGCRIESALLTNLTRDHLDYHGDMAHYAAAKVLLFQHPQLQRVILNADATFSARCVAVVPKSAVVAYYTCQAPQDPQQLSAVVMPQTHWGLTMAWQYRGQQVVLDSPLLGTFNVENLLVIALVLLDLGVAFTDLPAVLSQIHAVPGRLQTLGGGTAPWVVVDYAHTPDALAQVLASLRPYARSKLWCIVGCGGQRDRGKRPLMARIAALGADETVLTDDNPRFEASSDILEAMVSGMPPQGRYQVIADRAQAIATVLAAAHSGDVVLIAGKGHEKYQQIGAIKHPFDDVAIAQACLS